MNVITLSLRGSGATEAIQSLCIYHGLLRSARKDGNHWFACAWVLVASLFCTLPAFAAQIGVAAPARTVGVGDSFAVRVALDAQGASINALESHMTYPREHLNLIEIRDGNSTLTLWVERPHDADGTISFAGVVPGGFSGSDGEIFTLVFKAVGAGEARFAFPDGQALLNDGKGTKAPLTFSVPAFAIQKEGSGARVEPLAQSDRIPPEAFTPSLGNDPSLFNGQIFVAFATQDKGSGLDHYEVAEKTGFKISPSGYRTLAWHEAISPYLLHDQSQHSFIYVKAIDRAGNERIEALSPLHPLFYYDVRVLIGILIVSFLIMAAFYAYHKRSKRRFTYFA